MAAAPSLGSRAAGAACAEIFCMFCAQIELCAQHSDGSCSPSLLSVSARLQADLFPGALVYFGSDVKTGERFL